MAKGGKVHPKGAGTGVSEGGASSSGGKKGGAAAGGKAKGKGKDKPLSAEEKMQNRMVKMADLQVNLKSVNKNRKKNRKRRKRKGNAFTRGWEKLFGKEEEIVLNRKTREMVAALMISEEEVRELREIFNDVDIDKAGEMDFDEFFEILDEPRTPFTDAIFTIVDDPEHTGIEPLTVEERKQIEAQEGEGTALHVRGKLTFDDFVQAVCTFCMYAKDDILLFSFNAFDADNSGVIDETEFMQLCIIVNNDQPTYPDNFKLALTAFDKNEDGMMDFDEFRELNDKFPMLLFPAFRFQDKVQTRILGRRVWLDVARRVQLERERESYKRAHGGQEAPISFSERFFGCFYRQRHGKRRARKPPSAKDTALKKASQQTAAVAAENDSAKDTTGSQLRRDARGQNSVGRYKKNTGAGTPASPK